METGFLLLMSILIFGQLATNQPFDIAPPVPTGLYIGLTGVVIGGLCVLVLAIIVVAVLVIRSIKKKQTSKDNS